MAFHINQIILLLTMYLTHGCLASSMMKGGMSHLDFHAKGGKVELKMGGSMFSLRLHALTELKSDGVAVVNNLTANEKHGYDMFKDRDFTLSQPTYKNASTPAYHLKNMEAAVSLGNTNVTVKFVGLISEGNGTITEDSQTITDVVRGLACVRVEIGGWKFCGGSIVCNNEGVLETGELLDAKFEISTNGVSGASNTTGLKIVFGKATITVPKQVKADTTTSDMAAGYPDFDVDGNGKLMMTIRIPKFSMNAKYGHVCVSLDETHTSSAASLVAGLTSLIALFAAFWLH